VAVFLLRSVASGREMIRGIRAYCCRRPRDWVFTLNSILSKPRIDAAADTFDGIVAATTSLAMSRALGDCEVPCVNVSLAPEERLPTVRSDFQAAGEAGAKYLMTRGFRQLAFCGSPFGAASRPLEEGFCRLARQAGMTSQTHYRRKPTGTAGKVIDVAGLQAEMTQWVAGLPRPMAIMAANDSLACQVLDACRCLDLRVPQDVAVLGMGNDSALCRFSRPQLSSVALQSKRIGYQAAAVLDRLMAGQPPPRKPILIPPAGVVSRQSTNTFAIDDPRVSLAMRFIWEHACDRIQVPDVAEHVGISRRGLERRFRLVLGLSPHQAIRYVQLERAKRLLRETRVPIAKVAQASGLGDLKGIDIVFRRELHAAPSSFRQQRP
jgi:LacI family transcriptional regulator